MVPPVASTRTFGSGPDCCASAVPLASNAAATVRIHDGVFISALQSACTSLLPLGCPAPAPCSLGSPGRGALAFGLPCRRFCFAGLESLAIAARHRANRAPDVVVDVVVEVGEGHPHRPVRRIEPAAVQEDDAMVLRQPEHDVERMYVVLHPADDVLADVLACPELEVDQAIVPVEELVWSDLDAETLDRGLDALADNADAGLLVMLLIVHQLIEREQRHHDLLRERETCSVIERNVPAVGDDAVNETQLAWLERQRPRGLVGVSL